MAKKARNLAAGEFGPDHIYTRTAEKNLVSLYEARNNPGAFRPPGPVRQVKRKLNFSGGPAGKIALVFIFLCSVIFTGGVVSGMGEQPAVKPAPAAQVKEKGFLPYYRVEARFYPGPRVILGEEEVFFRPRESAGEVTFNLYLNRYQNKDLDASEIRRYTMKKGLAPGSIDIRGVFRGDRPVPFREEGQLLKVSPGKDFFAPRQQSLRIKYKINIPAGADRVGGNEKGIWLGNWLPTLSAAPRQYPPTEIGDPFINYASTYEVSFSVPGDYDLVLAGTRAEAGHGDRKVYSGKLERVRDLPVFLHRGFNRVTSSRGDMEINYYYTSPAGSPARVLAAAASAMAFYEKHVGDYPWEELNIVQNDMFLSGMEYSTLVLLSERAVQTNLKRTVFHEVGHQWFYNILGSNQYSAPYLDEGWVEFLSSYALDKRQLRPQAEFEGLNRDLGDFRSWWQYRKVHYQQGREWFESLCFYLGEDEFERFLQEYYRVFRYQLVDREEFERFVTQQTGNRSVRRLLGYLKE